MLLQQTGLEVQALPLPTPMTVIGEQFKPTSPVMGPRTIPRRPRRRVVRGSVAYVRKRVRFLC